MRPRGAVLAIIDGFGESAWRTGNGIAAARMPTMDYLKAHYPYVSLVASQQPVGLVRNEPGSSAVGHQTIGLGRTLPSYFQMLEKGMNPNSSDSLVNNKLLRSTFRKSKRLHFLGLCTDEGVFSHVKFLRPFLEAARAEKVPEVNLHCILTTLVRKPSSYLKMTEKTFPSDLNVRIVAVYSGDTAMDKTLNWNLTKVAYNAMINRSKPKRMQRKQLEVFLDGLKGMAPNFDPVYIEPAQGKAMREGDTVFIWHFREDKTWQIAEALINGIPGEPKRPELKVLPLVLYDPRQKDTPQVIPPIRAKNSLGEWISKQGFKQLRVAEKYKKAHITTFFSGGILQPVFEGEKRVTDFESVSENDADLYPEMNASRVTNVVVKAIEENIYKLIACNFANVDATGHTGNVTAVKLAAEHVDKMIKRLYDACQKHGYALFITSDHGNGEDDTELDGSPQIMHTVNSVPFIAVTDDYEIVPQRTGQAPYIGNVAASSLTVLGMDVPPEMEPSLLRPTQIHDNIAFSVSQRWFIIGFCTAFPLVLLLGRCVKTFRGCGRRPEWPTLPDFRI